MKLIKLHNPGNSDITDYPIAEAALDPDGNLVKKKDGYGYEETNRTLTWNIKAGETISFPFYVANYLKKVYDFLEVKGEEEVKKDEVGTGEPKCRHCGKEFTGMRGLGLHIAQAHPKEL